MTVPDDGGAAATTHMPYETCPLPSTATLMFVILGALSACTRTPLYAANSPSPIAVTIRAVQPRRIIVLHSIPVLVHGAPPGAARQLGQAVARTSSGHRPPAPRGADRLSPPHVACRSWPHACRNGHCSRPLRAERFCSRPIREVRQVGDLNAQPIGGGWYGATYGKHDAGRGTGRQGADQGTLRICGMRSCERDQRGHGVIDHRPRVLQREGEDRKSTRLNSSHLVISYAVFCLKKKTDY